MFFSYIIAYDPWGEASWDSRGLIGRIYVGDHYILLHTKYISSRPHGFREEVFFFLSFSHYKSMGANDPQGVANLGLRGLIGRIYVGDHQNIATYYTYKLWASWSKRKRCFKFLPL